MERRSTDAVRSKPSGEQQDEDDDQDDADDADTAVTVAVTVAAETAAEAAKQEDDEYDDKYKSHDLPPVAAPVYEVFEMVALNGSGAQDRHPV